MQQKVAERMDDLIPQSLWNDKHAAIDNRPCWSRGNGFHMTNTATDAPEKFSASYGCGRRGKRCVAGWNHRAAYELSKMVDVGQAKVIWLIFWVLCGLENCSHVCGAEPVCDSHLVEIGIANKGKQAAVLILPAEASDPCLSRSLKDRSLHNLPVNSTFAQLRLSLGDRDQSPVVDGFHKSIPQGVECGDFVRGHRRDADSVMRFGPGDQLTRPAADASAHARNFTGPRSHRIVPGVGHNMPQEAPRIFADAVLELVPHLKK